MAFLVYICERKLLFSASGYELKNGFPEGKMLFAFAAFVHNGSTVVNPIINASTPLSMTHVMKGKILFAFTAFVYNESTKLIQNTKIGFARFDSPQHDKI